MRGLYGESNKTVIEQIEEFRKFLFNFDYQLPTIPFNDDLKKHIETMFISHYINYYFSAETFDLFQVKLFSKMLEIMPLYSSIFENIYYNNQNIFADTTNIIKSGNANNNDNGVSKTQRINNNQDITNINSQNKDISSDLPIGIINFDNVDNISFADKGNLNNNEQHQERTSINDDNATTNNTNNSSSNYEDKENIIHQNYIIDKLIKLDEMQNTFTKFLNEFSVLFSQLV